MQNVEHQSPRSPTANIKKISKTWQMKKWLGLVTHLFGDAEGFKCINNANIKDIKNMAYEKK